MIPGLLNPLICAENEDFPRLPALETLLARSDESARMPAAGYEAMIFALFGQESERDKDLPVAAVTRVLDMGVIDQGWWLRADPVNLQPERDRLILTDGNALGIPQEEADRLVADILEVFAADGWVLKAPRPDRWYLKPRTVPSITTTPLPEVAGRDIHPFLPAGRDGKAWHAILNETQILLHAADVNAAREARGDLPINSLWFWGGGKLPEPVRPSWSRLWGDEPVSLALARLSSTPAVATPVDAGMWLQEAEAGEHLVVLHHGRTAAQYRRCEAWRGFMETLERNWIAPLIAAMQRRKLQGITVYAEPGARFQLTRRHLRRWWRRRRPVHACWNSFSMKDRG